MQRKLNNEMITIKNAQQMLQVNKKALKNLIRSGLLLSEKNGQNIEINLNSIKKYLQTDYSQNNHNEESKIKKDVSSSELEMIAEWT